MLLISAWLAMWLWASAGELSKVTRYSVQNVNYHLRRMRNNGTVEFRMVGRGREASRLWIFTSEEQHGPPPNDHPHDAIGRGEDGHYHHPLALLTDHIHAGWWESEAGYKRIYDMLEANVAFRDVAVEGVLKKSYAFSQRLVTHGWRMSAALLNWCSGFP